MTEQDGPAPVRVPTDPPTAPTEQATFDPEATQAHQTSPAAPPVSAGPPPRAMSPVEGAPPTAPMGVPPRPQPLPPPRPVRPAAGAVGPPRTGAPRPGSTARPVARTRKARLVLKRIDPWSVFLYSVVASIFLGLALLVAVAVLYGVLSGLGVLDSVNTLIGDVTNDPSDPTATTSIFGFGRVMSIAAVVAALDVVLLTALSTLGAFLYNLCASLTGGIEVTFGDRE